MKDLTETEKNDHATNLFKAKKISQWNKVMLFLSLSINLLQGFFFFFQSSDIILKQVGQCALSALDSVTSARKILEIVENQLETSKIILVHFYWFKKNWISYSSIED